MECNRKIVLDFFVGAFGTARNDRRFESERGVQRKRVGSGRARRQTRSSRSSLSTRWAELSLFTRGIMQGPA